MNKVIAAFGEVLWDLLPSGPVLGGAPFNFAFRINGLGDCGMVVSRLGRDDAGEEARRRIEELRMDDQYLQWDEDRPTGTVPVTLDEHGSPEYVITPNVAYDAIEVSDALLSLASSAHCLCFGTLSQRAACSRTTLYELLDAAPDAVRLLDLNLRKDCYTSETILISLRKAAILKLNDTEAAEVAELFNLPLRPLPEFCKQVIDRWGLSHCVVTLGSQGIFAASSSGEQAYEPGYRVVVADTIGSGDAFTAGFIHRFLAGDSLPESCQFGNILGAIVAGQHGGTCPISAAEIDSFSSNGYSRIIHPELKSS